MKCWLSVETFKRLGCFKRLSYRFQDVQDQSVMWASQMTWIFLICSTRKNYKRKERRKGKKSRPPWMLVMLRILILGKMLRTTIMSKKKSASGSLTDYSTSRKNLKMVLTLEVDVDSWLDTSLLRQWRTWKCTTLVRRCLIKFMAHQELTLRHICLNKKF